MPDDNEFAYVRSVLPGYFEAMQIPLLAGRDVEASDGEGTAQVMVINQTMAERLYPDRSPLGRNVVVDLLTRGSLTLRVAGVVGDVRIRGLGLGSSPVFYFSHAQDPETTMQVALRTAGEPESVAPFLRSAVRRLDRNIPVARVLTMDEAIADTLAERRVVAVFLTTFTLPTEQDMPFLDGLFMSATPLSRNRTAEPYIKMLDRAQRFSAKVDFASYEGARDILERANAFQEPADARFLDNF